MHVYTNHLSACRGRRSPESQCQQCRLLFSGWGHCSAVMSRCLFFFLYCCYCFCTNQGDSHPPPPIGGTTLEARLELEVEARAWLVEKHHSHVTHTARALLVRSQSTSPNESLLRKTNKQTKNFASEPPVTEVVTLYNGTL